MTIAALAAQHQLVVFCAIAGVLSDLAHCIAQFLLIQREDKGQLYPSDKDVVEEGWPGVLSGMSIN